MELRRHPRTELHTEIWLGQDGIFTRTPEILRDLSEGGAFVETSQRFSTGSVLHLRFKLPGAGSLISCTVRVRHVRSADGLGLEFLDLSPEDRNRVGVFVENRMPQSSR